MVMPLPQFRGRTESVSAWVRGARAQPAQSIGAVQEAGVKVPEIQAWSPLSSLCDCLGRLPSLRHWALVQSLPGYNLAGRIW